MGRRSQQTSPKSVVSDYRPIAVCRVAGPPLVPLVEEGLAVVLGQLGQAGHHLLHAELLLAQGGAARLPAQRAHKPRLLEIILQPRPRVVLDVQRRKLRVSRESARGGGGSEGGSGNRARS